MTKPEGSRFGQTWFQKVKVVPVYATKGYETAELQFHPFLTSALGTGSVTPVRCFTGPTAGYGVVKRSSIAPVGSRNTIPLTASPKPSYHTDYGIPGAIVYIAFNATESSRLVARDAVWSGINLSKPRKSIQSPHLEGGGGGGGGNMFLRKVDNFPGVPSQRTAMFTIKAVTTAAWQ